MKRAILALGLSAAFAVPAMAAEPNETDKSNAARECSKLREGMGKTNFAQTFGTNSNRSNAYGKCVSRFAREEAAEREAARKNAAKQCKAEREDANFAASHDGKSFAQFYGTGPKRKNAYGKCVSAKAKQNKQKSDKADEERDERLINAAKACRTEQKDPDFASEHGGKSFREFYGTNENGRNAFGKCVSKKARARQQSS
jgi:hypothetical protein